jgi:hypothetical protein
LKLRSLPPRVGRKVGSAVVVGLLLALPVFLLTGIPTSQAGTADPLLKANLIRLTNTAFQKTLMLDARYGLQDSSLKGLYQSGAMVAWSGFPSPSSGLPAVINSYAVLSTSSSTVKNISTPAGYAVAAGGAMDQGVVLIQMSNTTAAAAAKPSQYAYMYDTVTENGLTIPLFNTATDYTFCTQVYCNFSNLFPNGQGWIGIGPYLRVNASQDGHQQRLYTTEISGTPLGRWSQLTPSDYQLLPTACQYYNTTTNTLQNTTAVFDPTAPTNLVSGLAGQHAYAVTNYVMDGWLSGCTVAQHATRVDLVMEPGHVVAATFNPNPGDPAHNVPTCGSPTSGPCFQGLSTYNNNILLYTTFNPTQVWFFDRSLMQGAPLVNFSHMITDGNRILWDSYSPSSPSPYGVYLYDPSFAQPGHTLKLGTSLSQPSLVGVSSKWAVYVNVTSSSGVYQVNSFGLGSGQFLPSVQASVGNFLFDNDRVFWLDASSSSSVNSTLFWYDLTQPSPAVGQVDVSALGFSGNGPFMSTFMGSSYRFIFLCGTPWGESYPQVFALDLFALQAGGGTSNTANSSTQSTSSSSGTSQRSSTTSTSNTNTTTGGVNTGVGGTSGGIPTGYLLGGGAAGGGLGLLGYVFYRAGRRRTKRRKKTPKPPGPVSPTDAGTTAREKKEEAKDCSKEKLAYETALAKYNKLKGIDQTAYDLSASKNPIGPAPMDPTGNWMLEVNLDNAWTNLVEARLDYAQCLGVLPSMIGPLPLDPDDKFHPDGG